MGKLVHELPSGGAKKTPWKWKWFTDDHAPALLKPAAQQRSDRQPALLLAVRS